MENLGNITVAVLAVVALAFFIVGPFVNAVTARAKPPAPEPLREGDWSAVVEHASAARWLGTLEGLISLAAFWMGEYAILVGWLAFKVAAKWEVWKNIVQVPATLGSVSQLNYLKARNAWGSWLLARFLIGTIVNILIGLVAYYLGKHLSVTFIIPGGAMNLSISASVADWLVAAGTLVLAFVAVFQGTIRGWFYRPSFEVSTKTEPPDCVAVPISNQDGTVIANAVYLRLWVENVGNATAKNVEVYAKELRRQPANGNDWARVRAFPPMNLNWANWGKIYFPSIAPKMGKHCDLGHIIDPAHRLREAAPQLGLTDQQTSLAFDLMVAPNHRGHIIGPGEYQLDILVAAENAQPIKRTILFSLLGGWDADETKMLRDGVRLTIMR